MAYSGGYTYFQVHRQTNGIQLDCRKILVDLSQTKCARFSLVWAWRVTSGIQHRIALDSSRPSGARRLMRVRLGDVETGSHQPILFFAVLLPKLIHFRFTPERISCHISELFLSQLGSYPACFQPLWNPQSLPLPYLSV